MNEIEVTISEDEFVRAQRLFGRLSSKMKVLYLVSAVVLIGIALVGGTQAKVIALCALVGGIAGHFAVSRVLVPRRSRKTYRNYPMIQKPFVLKPEVYGVFFKSEAGSAMLKWANIHKWRENDEFVLIYPAPNLFHVVPKRLSASGLELHSLTSALESNVGSAT